METTKVSTNGWINMENVVCIYTQRQREREKWNIAIVAIQIDLEGIMLSKISNIEKQILYDLIYMWNLKEKKLIYTEQSHGYQKQGVEVL